MENLNFNLTLNETNIILNALGQMPYTQVYQLVQKIQSQASTQLQSNGSGSPFASPSQS
jgi:hypothetical protein